MSSNAQYTIQMMENPGVPTIGEGLEVKYYEICGNSFTDDKAELACKSVGFSRGVISWRSSTDIHGMETSGGVRVSSCEVDAANLLNCSMNKLECETHVVLLCKGKEIWQYL